MESISTNCGKKIQPLSVLDAEVQPMIADVKSRSDELKFVLLFSSLNDFEKPVYN
jgi:hypothetical protein